jgi:hypothetical protein
LGRDRRYFLPNTCVLYIQVGHYLEPLRPRKRARSSNGRIPTIIIPTTNSATGEVLLCRESTITATPRTKTTTRRTQSNAPCQSITKL